MRSARIERKTHETDILVEVNLDGTGAYDVSTGIGFLDHMIEQFSRHSLIDLKCRIKGDLHVDQHHTTEVSAIAIGQAILSALGDKGGIGRYGTAYSPMDEARFSMMMKDGALALYGDRDDVLAEMSQGAPKPVVIDIKDKKKKG